MGHLHFESQTSNTRLLLANKYCNYHDITDEYTISRASNNPFSAHPSTFAHVPLTSILPLTSGLNLTGLWKLKTLLISYSMRTRYPKAQYGTTITINSKF